MLIKFCLKPFFKIINWFLCLTIGQKYKNFVRKCSELYSFALKLYSNEELKDENDINDITARLDRSKQKIMALQNQVVSLQRQVEELFKGAPKGYKVIPETTSISTSPLRRTSPPIPPSPRSPVSRPSSPITKSYIPPPPPPPPPFCGPAPSMISKTDNQKVILKASRVLPENVSPTNPNPPEPKRVKPSSTDLVKRKGQLRSTSVRRSPGGTPLTHWKAHDIDISSPEDSAIASVMKKALKRKFKNMRPFSPPSPIEGSGEEDFSF